MKINYSDPSSVPFSSIEVGRIFEYNGNIYIKIPNIKTMDEIVCNSYDLANNSYLYLFNDDFVAPYPNATLNLT